jgi:hypothetical protein
MHKKSSRKARSGATIAAVVAGLSVAGCLAVFWADSFAYADLSAARLGALVGVKGECCVPGGKTSCSSIAPYACTTEGIVCDSGSAFDQCGSPSCRDSDEDEDACGSDAFGEYSVSATVCYVIPGVIVPCEPEGNRCMYFTGEHTVDFVGCGGSTVCASTPGPACQ